MKRWKLSRKTSQRLETGQVWVYRGEVEAELTAETLDTVLLVDDRGRLIGSALVDGASPVPVRLYSRREQVLDGDLIATRVQGAMEWRKRLALGASTGYRLVFSEADGLPGLTIDRFGAGLGIQCNVRNYGEYLDLIVGKIQEQLGPEDRIDCVVRELGGERTLFLGDEAKAKPIYRMNQLKFEADLLEGPKTGAFLDQRENYFAATNWIRLLGIYGRGLDLYSSYGGFALHLAGVLDKVDAVDSSKTAVTGIVENARRNELNNVRAIESDVKQFLRGLGQARRQYECVIADPPAFAKQVRQKEEATRAYYDLNLRALSAVAPSGMFVSCSCSRAVSESDLLNVIREAAQQSRKTLTLLEKRSQALDHREVISIPETSYLKCLYFSVSTSH